MRWNCDVFGALTTLNTPLHTFKALVLWKKIIIFPPWGKLLLFSQFSSTLSIMIWQLLCAREHILCAFVLGASANVLYRSAPFLFCPAPVMIIFSPCLFPCCFSRCEGEVGQEILRGRRLQLHVFAAEPGGRHAVRRSQGGTVRPQPVGHQQDQAAEERECVERWAAACECAGPGSMIDSSFKHVCSWHLETNLSNALSQHCGFNTRKMQNWTPSWFLMLFVSFFIFLHITHASCCCCLFFFCVCAYFHLKESGFSRCSGLSRVPRISHDLFRVFFFIFSWRGALLLEREKSAASKGRTWRWVASRTSPPTQENNEKKKKNLVWAATWTFSCRLNRMSIVKCWQRSSTSYK